MKSTSSSDGQMALTVTFKGGTDIDLAADAGAEPRGAGGSAPARGGACARRHDRQGVADAHDGRAPRLAQQDLRRALPLQLREPARARRARPPAGRRPGARVRHRQLRHARLDRPGARGGALAVGDATSSPRSASRTSKSPPAAIGGPPTPAGSVLQVSINAQGRLASPEAFGEIVLKSEGTELTRLKDVARIELGANTYAIRSLLNNEDAAAIVIFEAPGANTIALSEAIRARMQELERQLPRGRPLVGRLRPDGVRAGLHRRRSSRRCSRRSRWS